jgi:hypothetical protein
MPDVNDAALPAEAVDEAASGLAAVAAGFAEEVGGAPTLAEFLEILGWAIPARDDATDGTFPEPLRFKVGLAGNKRYGSDKASRVPELNDHLFEDARGYNTTLARRLNAASGAPVTPQQFASALLQVLRTGKIVPADVKGEDIRKITAEVPKKRAAKPKVGDVVGIPAKEGYRLGVVLAQDRFGTALGLFDGTSAQGRLDAALRRSPRKHPVYTDDGQVKNGAWKVLDHDESLLSLFPAEPAIYHRPGAWPGIDTGEHGAAETADGTLRMIGPDEAREVGLQDDSYRQAYAAAYLQKHLDEQDGA